MLTATPVLYGNMITTTLRVIHIFFLSRPFLHSYYLLSFKFFHGLFYIHIIIFCSIYNNMMSLVRANAIKPNLKSTLHPNLSTYFPDYLFLLDKNTSTPWDGIRMSFHLTLELSPSFSTRVPHKFGKIQKMNKRI